MSNPIKLRTTSGWIRESVSCNQPSWGFKAEIVDKVTGSVIACGTAIKSKRAAQERACAAAGIELSSFGIA